MCLKDVIIEGLLHLMMNGSCNQNHWIFFDYDLPYQKG